MTIKRPQPIDEGTLRPAARPVDTFVRPQAPPERGGWDRRTDLQQLAQALGNFSGSLAEYGRAQQADPTGEAIARREVMANTLDDVSDKVAGKKPMDPRTNLVVLHTLHGEERARQDFQEMRRRYLGQSTAAQGQPSNAFDREHGDLDQFFADFTKEKVSGLPPNAPMVNVAYLKQFEAYKRELYGEQDAYLQGRVKEANADAGYKAVVGTVDELVAGGGTDAKSVAGEVFKRLPKLRNMHMLSPQEADDAVVRAAQFIADRGIPGNPQLGPEVVRELLLSDRDGVGPIGGKAAYAHKATGILDAATKKAGELQRDGNVDVTVSFKEQASQGQLDEATFKEVMKANPGFMTHTQQEAILLQNREARLKAREKLRKEVDRIALEAKSQTSELEITGMLGQHGDKGTLLAIPEGVQHVKKDGTIGTYSREALLKRAVHEQLTSGDAWVKSVTTPASASPQDMSVVLRPEQATAERFARDVEWFTKNQLTNPQWQDTLNRGFAAASPDNIAKGQMPPVLTQALALYSQLEAGHVGVLKRHLSSKSARDFYEVYSAVRQWSGDERQAILQATMAADPEQAALKRKLVDKEMKKTGSWAPWADSVVNLGDMRDDVRELATVLVRAGMQPEDALPVAGEKVRKAYTNINGNMVRTADRNVESFGTVLRSAGLQPRDFGDVVRDYLTAWDEKTSGRADQKAPHAAIGSAAGPGGLFVDAWLEPEKGSLQSDPALPPRRLSIRPVSEGAGTWAVVDMSNPWAPVAESPRGLPQVFSLRDLMAFEKSKQGPARQKQFDDLTKRNKAAREAAERRDWAREWLDENPTAVIAA